MLKLVIILLNTVIFIMDIHTIIFIIIIHTYINYYYGFNPDKLGK